MCLTAGAQAQQPSRGEYGSQLIIDADAALPDIPHIDTQHSVRPYMPSVEPVTDTFGVELAEVIENDELLFSHRYQTQDVNILSSSNGCFTYTNGNPKTLVSLLYYCIDANEKFHPDKIIVNTAELDFMTADEACTLVSDTVRSVFPEVCDSFDISLIAHPVHVEDMRAKVDAILAEDCSSPDDLDFYKQKHGLYDGCISDDAGCYFIEASLQFNDTPLLKGTLRLSDEVYADGPRLWCIVGRDGIAYLSFYDMLYICAEKGLTTYQSSCDKLSANAGAYLNMRKLGPYEIDRVELVYVPYPVGDYEYELTPLLLLNQYDESDGTYSTLLKINVKNSELYF